VFKYLVLSMTLGVAGVVCFGQTSSNVVVCPAAKTQTELNECASQTAKHADAELNDVYTKLLSKISGNQTAVSKVKSAERAWVTYRDAYIEAMYPAADKQAHYGTMFPMEVDLLRSKLTHDQITALKDLLDRYNELN
jgi:uncharacterized protein YecT (DUF1311 family)